MRRNNLKAANTSDSPEAIDFGELLIALGELPVELRFALVPDYHFNSEQILRILPLLADEHRLDFFTKHQSEINSFDKLKNLLFLLPPDVREIFATTSFRHIKNNPELCELLLLLPLSHRTEFSSLFRQAYIKDGRELVSVLELLPEFNREEFCSLCQDKIQNGDELAKILKFFPKNKRVEWVKRHIDKIQNGFELAEVLSWLPEKGRMGFITEKQVNKIRDIEQLVRVLGHLPPKRRSAIAGSCQSLVANAEQWAWVLYKLPEQERSVFASTHTLKILDGYELARILNCLPRDERMKFVNIYQDKIQDGDELLEVHCVLPLNERMDFAKWHQAKITNAEQWIILLKNLPEENRAEFSEILKLKIVTLTELDTVFGLLGSRVTGAQKRREFVEGCRDHLRIHYHLREKHYERKLFNDPVVQQMILLQALNPNLFLFSEAVDPARESDFDFFLQHPSCFAGALNARGQSLLSYIDRHPILAPELKMLRITKVKDRLELLRTHRAAGYLGFNLGSIQPLSRHFPAQRLPQVESTFWEVVGVDAKEIELFRRLTYWLQTHPALVSYQAAFKDFENNTGFRVVTSFKTILEALEHFVVCLNDYLEHRKPVDAESSKEGPALSTYLDACDQLKVCPEGVLTALQGMTRSLNPSAALNNAVDVALDQAIKQFVAWVGIEVGNEVHVPKNALWAQLGVNFSDHYDPYRLPINSAYLQAIVRHASGQLTPERLVTESLPYLESTPHWKEEEVVLNAGLFNALGRDWQTLRGMGLVENQAESEEKWVDVLCFISHLSRVEAKELLKKHLVGDMNQPVQLSLSFEEIKRRYHGALERSGILTLSTKTVDELRERIWRLLSTANFSEGDDNVFWQYLLSVPNGLGWIKAVIDSRAPTEWSQIKLQALLHCPHSFSNNLFRALACDPFLAPWMMGYEIKRGGDGLLYFNFRGAQPLGEVLSLLHKNPRILYEEREKIFVQPCNLLFSLMVLKEDRHEGLFPCVMNFIDVRGIYGFDSLLNVLVIMMRQGEPAQRVMAQSFLEFRCEQQKTCGLWDCYWRSACYLSQGFEFDCSAMVLSLQNPENARAALYIVGSTHDLVVKILKTCADGLISQEELVKVLMSIQNLYLAGPAQTVFHAPPATAHELNKAGGAEIQTPSFSR